MEHIVSAEDGRKPTRGIKIFALTEIILGLLQIALGILLLIIVIDLYKPNTNDFAVGLASTIGPSFLLLGALFFITGKLMLSLKPAGRILSLFILVFFLPLSILLYIYLFRKDVRAQFKKQ